MIVPDVNLLIYAYDEQASRHEAAKVWWRDCLSGSEPVGLCHTVVFAFLRISTLASVFEKPFTLAKATKVVGDWMARSVTRTLSPGPDHVDQVLKLLEAAGSSGGNLVSDAQIAALALAHKGTVHTADHDFARFKGLACHFPLDE